jgi:hypothetical protein
MERAPEKLATAPPTASRVEGAMSRGVPVERIKGSEDPGGQAAGNGPMARPTFDSNTMDRLI